MFWHLKLPCALAAWSVRVVGLLGFGLFVFLKQV